MTSNYFVDDDRVFMTASASLDIVLNPQEIKDIEPCPICRNLNLLPYQFVEPIKLSCGHILCASCNFSIESSFLTGHKKCPFCRQSCLSFPDINLYNKIRKNLVSCPSCNKQKIPIGDLKRHIMTECEKTNGKCEFCGEFMIYKKLLSHFNFCPNAIVPCSFQHKTPDQKCYYFIERRYLDQHLEQHEQKIECKICSKLIPILTYREHCEEFHVKTYEEATDISYLHADINFS